MHINLKAVFSTFVDHKLAPTPHSLPIAYTTYFVQIQYDTERDSSIFRGYILHAGQRLNTVSEKC